MANRTGGWLFTCFFNHVAKKQTGCPEYIRMIEPPTPSSRKELTKQ